MILTRKLGFCPMGEVVAAAARRGAQALRIAASVAERCFGGWCGVWGNGRPSFVIPQRWQGRGRAPWGVGRLPRSAVRSVLSRGSSPRRPVRVSGAEKRPSGREQPQVRREPCGSPE